MDDVTKWSIDDMIEVKLKEDDDFLKVKETLTRIGIASRKEKKLFITNLKHPQLPYPKEAINKAEVIKHEVHEKGFYDE